MFAATRNVQNKEERLDVLVDLFRNHPLPLHPHCACVRDCTVVT